MFDGNFQINFPFNFFKPGNTKKEDKQNLLEEKQTQENKKQNPTETPKESLVNTNSNIPLNQSTLTNQTTTQGALNTVNKKNTTNIEENTTKETSQTTTSKNINPLGTKDIPHFSGISGLSLKSWLAEHSNKNFANLSNEEKELAVTLDGIKGFQEKNYKGNEDAPKQGNRAKNLLILSHIFSESENPLLQISEVVTGVSTFKKLGINKNQDNLLEEISKRFEKAAPPIPEDIQYLTKTNITGHKYLNQLFALPREFPEFIRLFTGSNIEYNYPNIVSFIERRLTFIKEKTHGRDKLFDTTLSKLATIINQSESSLILPILLYYPYPLPKINYQENIEKNKLTDEEIISTCTIYYSSGILGRFTIKIFLKKKDILSVEIETNKQNEKIIDEIEEAISEAIFLLEIPPKLKDLNILLTKEIYEATDQDEELSIISSGANRIEILLAAYAVLIILNRFNKQEDYIIEISE